MNIPKLKPTEYIVLYEHSFERDCFGDVDISNEFKIFGSKKEAFVFIDTMKNNCHCSNFVGPLKLA